MLVNRLFASYVLYRTHTLIAKFPSPSAYKQGPSIHRYISMACSGLFAVVVPVCPIWLLPL
jgi:hypothetical protein